MPLRQEGSLSPARTPPVQGPSERRSIASPAAASRYRGRDNPVCVDSWCNNPNFLRQRAAGGRAAPGPGVTEERRHRARLSSPALPGAAANLALRPQSSVWNLPCTTSASAPHVPSVLGLNRANSSPLHPPKLLADALFLTWRRGIIYFFFLMFISACANDFIWPQHNRIGLFFFFFAFPPSLHLHARMCNNIENWFLPLYYLWITCIPSLQANKEIGNLSSFASGYPYDTLFLYLL